jgi:hypothetical protein
MLVRRLPQIYQGHMLVVRFAGFGGQGPCQGFAILFHQMEEELPVLRDIVIASKGVNDQVNGQVICMDPGMLCMRSCPAVGEALGNVCRCGSTKIQKQIGIVGCSAFAERPTSNTALAKRFLAALALPSEVELIMLLLTGIMSFPR